MLSQTHDSLVAIKQQAQPAAHCCQIDIDRLLPAVAGAGNEVATLRNACGWSAQR